MKARKEFWYDAVLFSVAAALYAPSLGNGFAGDDLIFFVGNPLIASFDLRTILVNGAIGGADYLPLRDLSFALDHLLWGWDPFGFHLTNVVLFGLTAVCVRRLFQSANAFLAKGAATAYAIPSFLAALVFAIHPNNREAVYAVHNRGALLTVIFSMLACLLFIGFLRGGNRRFGQYAASLACFLCAVLSREYGIAIPLVLALLAWFDERPKRNAALLATVPFFAAAALLFAVHREVAVATRSIVFSPSESLPAEILSKAAVAAKIMLFYMVRMATSLGTFTFDDSLPFALLSLSIVAGAGYCALRMRTTRPGVLFGFVFYLICLLPVLNLYRTLPVVAPRYGFLPSVGLFFLLSTVPFDRTKRIIPVAVVLLVALWNVSTMHKTRYWKDNVTFWEFIAERDQNPFCDTQLGYAYYAEHRYRETVEALQKAQADPADSRYHATLGTACLEMGDYPCAVEHLSSAIELAGPHRHLVDCLSRARQALRGIPPAR